MEKSPFSGKVQAVKAGKQKLPYSGLHGNRSKQNWFQACRRDIRSSLAMLSVPEPEYMPPWQAHNHTAREKHVQTKGSPDNIELYKMQKTWLSVTQRAGTFLGTSEITQLFYAEEYAS